MTNDEALSFYTALTQKVVEEIKEQNYDSIVFGPLLTLTEAYPDNVAFLKENQMKAAEQGFKVYDQVPHLDIHLENAPYRFDIKFPEFFGGILKSGLIKHAFFVPGWEQVEGCRSEHNYCVEHNVTIHYL